MARKNPAAVSLGRKGGKARLRTMTKEQRMLSAQRAAQARWQKEKEAIEAANYEAKTLLESAKKRAKKES